MLELTQAWAAVTGLLIIALMLVVVGTGHRLTQALPMLIAGIVGYEMAMVGYGLWRRHREGHGHG